VWVSEMRKRDALIWFAIVVLVVFVQRLTSGWSWREDVWLAVIAASVSVGAAALARNRRPGR
jgi:hypothetical protein